MTGPLCRVCTLEHHYFDADTSSCKPCVLQGGTAIMGAVGIICAVAVGVIALVLGWRALMRFEGRSRQGAAGAAYKLRKHLVRAAHTAQRIGWVGKAKVVVGYFQVVLVIPRAYSIELPPEYHELCAPPSPPARHRVRCVERHVPVPAISDWPYLVVSVRRARAGCAHSRGSPYHGSTWSRNLRATAVSKNGWPCRPTCPWP